MEAIFFTVMTTFQRHRNRHRHSMAGRTIFIGCPKSASYISIIPCDGHREDVEYLVKNTYVGMTDQCRCKNCSIILVDCGMDTETREYSGICWYTIWSLSKYAIALRLAPLYRKISIANHRILLYDID